MLEIKIYNMGEINNDQFDFAVISASYKGNWIFVRHRERETWEIPGGHREEQEDINCTATRELYEETGAVNFEMEPVCDYSVTIGGTTTFGRLFYATVQEMGDLPDSEICEVKLLRELPDNLTYAEIQPQLHQKVLQHLSEKTIKLLKKDENRNINMINFIKSYPVYTFDHVGDSVLIRGRSDEAWVYISSANEQEFFQLFQGLDDKDKCFAVLEDWMLPYIAGDREIRSQLTSIKLVYDHKTPLPSEKHNTVSLSAAKAPYIFENYEYSEYSSIDYIEDRIMNGIGVGIYENDKLVAWSITHDDGAIGFLHVLEEYRRMGYGMDVTVAVIRKLLELGEVPFVHIEEENIKSMSLAMKTGFRKDRRIHWIKLS